QTCAHENREFHSWFEDYRGFAAIMTILAGADINFLRLMCSKFGGFRMFSCGFSSAALKTIVSIEFINSIIEDIPQFIIQILYKIHTTGYSTFSHRENKNNNTQLVIPESVQTLNVLNNNYYGQDYQHNPSIERRQIG
ncbi:17212_t:CDS:2, partial [Racocetra persica]